MKKLFLIFITFVFPLFLNAIEAKTYKVVISSDWKPYYMLDKNNQPTGYAIELFEAIAKEVGLKYEYVIEDNFSDIMEKFKTQQVDIMPNMSIRKQREDVLLFSNPTDTFLINIYKRSNTTSITNLTHLEGTKIGLVTNNICSKLIQSEYKEIEKKFYSTYLELIDALLNKEIDTFCYPKPLIDVKHDLKGEITTLKDSLAEIKRGIGVSQAHPELIAVFNEAIEKFRMNGRLYEIHDNWFIKKSFIELTQKETILLVLSFFGIIFTSLIIAHYLINKKRWLLTKKTLQEEVLKSTKVLKIQNMRLKKVQRKLNAQLNTDTLTNAYNRKYYNQKIEELLALHKRYETPFSFLIFDIDDFKKVNDTYGHCVGDEVLIELSKLIKQHIRETDFFFRVGGEEFIVLFAGTALKDASIVSIKLNKIIESKLNVIQNRTITISLGLTQVLQNDDEYSIFKRADELLYEAKKSGKNQLKME